MRTWLQTQSADGARLRTHCQRAGARWFAGVALAIAVAACGSEKEPGERAAGTGTGAPAAQRTSFIETAPGGRQRHRVPPPDHRPVASRPGSPVRAGEDTADPDRLLSTINVRQGEDADALDEKFHALLRRAATACVRGLRRRPRPGLADRLRRGPAAAV